MRCRSIVEWAELTAEILTRMTGDPVRAEVKNGRIVIKRWDSTGKLVKV